MAVRREHEVADRVRSERLNGRTHFGRIQKGDEAPRSDEYLAVIVGAPAAAQDSSQKEHNGSQPEIQAPRRFMCYRPTRRLSHVDVPPVVVNAVNHKLPDTHSPLIWP